jgi:hypothetical protein
LVLRCRVRDYGRQPAGNSVEFDDRSWIEVRDATQKIVLVGEYAAGTRHSVDGKAPFQLWIGRASGVRVYMGERSIDLKPHTREEVARSAWNERDRFLPKAASKPHGHGSQESALAVRRRWSSSR